MGWRRPAILLMGAVTLVGCELTQLDARKGTDLLPAMHSAGQRLTPKQCILKFAIVARPLSDDALASILWSRADAQAVPDDLRRGLAANGLQIGVITGELPVEVQEVLNAPPPARWIPLQSSCRMATRRSSTWSRPRSA